MSAEVITFLTKSKVRSKMKKRIISIAMVLALISVAALPMGVWGETTGETVVSGTMGDTIAVAAPGDFQLVLDPSAPQPITSAAKTVAVSANGTRTWNLKAHEEGGDGKMASGGDLLGSAIVLNAGTDVTLSGTAQNIVTNHAAGSADIAVVFKQTVSYSDKVHTDYALTVTFTVELNP